jgi:hypothetical protein
VDPSLSDNATKFGSTQPKDGRNISQKVNLAETENFVDVLFRAIVELEAAIEYGRRHNDVSEVRV